MESLVVLPDLTESQRILPLQSKLGHGWCSLQFFESEAFLGAVDEEDKSEIGDEVFMVCLKGCSETSKLLILISSRIIVIMITIAIFIKPSLYLYYIYWIDR